MLPSLQHLSSRTNDTQDRLRARTETRRVRLVARLDVARAEAERARAVIVIVRRAEANFDEARETLRANMEQEEEQEEEEEKEEQEQEEQEQEQEEQEEQEEEQEEQEQEEEDGSIPRNGRTAEWTVASVSSLWALLTETQTAAFQKENGRDPSTVEQQSWQVSRAQLIFALRTHPDLKASLGLLENESISENGEGARNVKYVARLMDALQNTERNYTEKTVTYRMWLQLLGAGDTKMNTLHTLDTAALAQYVCAVLGDVPIKF